MIYFELFYVFFTIGLFTFGGGHAMIPLLQQQVVAHGWVSEQTVVDFIAVSESTPGPFSINMATFVGNKMGGGLGTFMAVLGVVLPSFLVILIIAKFLSNFKNNPYVKGAMQMLHPVVLALIAYATVNVSITALSSTNSLGFDPYAALIIAILFALTKVVKKIHPILLIMLSAAMGILVYGVIL